MTRHQSSLKKAVSNLRSQEAEIQQRLQDVRETIGRLAEIGGFSRRGVARASSTQGSNRSRRLSAEGREAISKAAKKRWAAYRKRKRLAQSSS